MNRLLFWCGVVALMTSLLVPLVPARAAEEPDLIFKRSTVFLRPFHRLMRRAPRPKAEARLGERRVPVRL